MDKYSAIIDPSLTSLPAEDRARYTEITDDILAEYGGEVVSSDDVLEMLRGRVSLALTRQRHHIKMVIMERLRMQPTPQTVALSRTGDVWTTPGVDSMAAAVFNIPELLESILYHVPIVDLTRSRRVNKAVHRLIETSPMLQRKLFLLPSNDPPRYWGWIRNNDTDELVTSPNNPPPASETSHDAPNTIARLNPLLTAEDHYLYSSPQETHAIGLVHSTQIDKRILNAKVWPEMYLTSPPCTSVHFSFVFSEQSKQARLYVRRTVRDPAGVTFATLWDELHKEGDVIICGDYEPVPGTGFDPVEVERSTAREQIDHHRRRGIRISLSEDGCYIDSYRVAILIPGMEW